MAVTKKAQVDKAVSVQPMKLVTIQLQLVSSNSLLMHKLGDTSDKTKYSDSELFANALYHAHGSTENKPLYGLPAAAFNRAIEAAARFHKVKKDHGQAFWKGAIRISADPLGMIPFTRWTSPVLAKTQGRNPSTGGVIPVVRARFDKWEAVLQIGFNETIIPYDVIVNQVIYAGFHVGVGAFRAEKGGTHGTFDVKVRK